MAQLNPGDCYRDEDNKVWRQRGYRGTPLMVQGGPLNKNDPLVWITEDARYVLLTEMETTHLRNCLAQMLLRANGWRSGYLEPIAEELKKRND